MHPVLKKLEFFGLLPSKDRVFVERFLTLEENVAANIDLIREGDAPAEMHLITDGLACRYKRLADGKRQIVAFLVPGDFADPYAAMLNTMDHSISTLARSKVVRVPREAILRMMERPAIARALSIAALADSAILREWIATLGQRSAEKRMAHLFCEITARLRAVGMMSHAGVVRFPLSQNQLSDTLGLSSVHTNRSLKVLREKNLIKFASGNLEILDTKALEELCDFTPNYLHLPDPALHTAATFSGDALFVEPRQARMPQVA